MKITKDKKFNRHAVLEPVLEIDIERRLFCGMTLVIPYNTTVIMKSGKFVKASATEVVFILPDAELTASGIVISPVIVLPGMRQAIRVNLINATNNQVTLKGTQILACMHSLKVAKQGTEEELEESEEKDTEDVKT